MSFNQMMQKNKFPSIITLLEKEYKNAIFYGQMLDNKPHGFGLTICDEEYFILCRWKKGTLQGPYFIYDNKSQEGLYPFCFYGTISQSKLINTNYICSIDQKMMMAKYKEGKNEGSIYFKKSKQVRSFTYENGIIKQNEKIKDSKNIQFKSISQHLQEIINHTQNRVFTKKKLTESEVFIGGSNDNTSGAYGFILRYNWPYMWGKFSNYKLHGLGVIFESQMHRIEGFFKNGYLEHGVIFQKQLGKTYFVTYDPKHQQKFITQTVVDKITNRQMQTLRRNLHMKSLNFQNDYFIEPNFSRVWPRQLLDLISHQEVVGDMLHSLVPPLGISQISRLAENSENRVQKQLLHALHEYQEFQQGFDRMSRLISDRINQPNNQADHKSKTPRKNIYKPSKKKPEKVHKIQISPSGTLQKNDKKLLRNKQSQKGKLYKPLIFPKLPIKQIKNSQNHLNLHKIYSMYLKA